MPTDKLLLSEHLQAVSREFHNVQRWERNNLLQNISTLSLVEDAEAYLEEALRTPKIVSKGAQLSSTLYIKAFLIVAYMVPQKVILRHNVPALEAFARFHQNNPEDYYLVGQVLSLLKSAPQFHDLRGHIFYYLVDYKKVFEGKFDLFSTLRTFVEDFYTSMGQGDDAQMVKSDTLHKSPVMANFSQWSKDDHPNTEETNDTVAYTAAQNWRIPETEDQLQADDVSSYANNLEGYNEGAYVAAPPRHFPRQSSEEFQSDTAPPHSEDDPDARLYQQPETPYTNENSQPSSASSESYIWVAPTHFKSSEQLRCIIEQDNDLDKPATHKVVDVGAQFDRLELTDPVTRGTQEATDLTNEDEDDTNDRNMVRLDNSDTFSAVPDSSDRYAKATDERGYFLSHQPEGYAIGSKSETNFHHRDISEERGSQPEISPPPDFPPIDCKTLSLFILSYDRKLLIIDIRPQPVFSHNNTSHIVRATHVINIDPNLIRLAGTDAELEVLLQRNCVDLLHSQYFSNRSLFDRLMVYDEGRNDVSSIATIAKFWNLMKPGNQTKPLKHSPRLLTGGYQAWMAFCAKSQTPAAQVYGPRSQPVSVDSGAQPQPVDQRFQLYGPRFQGQPPYSSLSSQTHLQTQPSNSPAMPRANPVQYQPVYDRASLPTPYAPVPYPSPPYPIYNTYIPSQSPPPMAPYMPLFLSPGLVPGVHTYIQAEPQAVQVAYQRNASQVAPQPYQLVPQRGTQERQMHPSQKTRPVSGPPPQQRPPQVNTPYVSMCICGIRNYGCTCYINSMLQCLFALTAFSSLFEDSQYKSFLKSQQYKETLSHAFFNLMRSIHDHGGCSIAPSRFLRVCAAARRDFNIPYEQQDTQEFLMFLLDTLHGELSGNNEAVSQIAPDRAVWVKPSSDQAIANIETSQKAYAKFQTELTSLGLSPVSALFQGQIESKLKCNKCGFESPTFNVFNTLTLPIPKNHSKKVRLEDCLDLYSRDELMEGDNAWSCPKCHDPNEEAKAKRASGFRFARKKLVKHHKITSVKSLSFLSLPRYLVVHLSRFESGSSNVDKLNTVVSYPLVLQMKVGAGSTQRIETYKLYALVNHYGSLKSGHYTSLINKLSSHDLHNPYWCYFDDENVKVGVIHGDARNGAMSVKSADVYVLFYEKVDEG
ncbi:hypothetical protein BABINDRAFT_160426 [Babjeviella inositovora NRRL Y-12698]|uniref:ubiquitinyl hydrolase 1 n=1 Tax=Babjeviella inositovora NRRL Y-12698 TaxID=984486 RepID=A0A1E3QTI9_9ASCO|nr:uncharacterized protein BABINDRAFT_160426 [Babjeviella inositovora NRRL Y-12698]ODQ81005.1 hypothetical protein BABINDRAFT_160426 [Babjeviella inositovora NRRL Y-12698]